MRPMSCIAPHEAIRHGMRNLRPKLDMTKHDNRIIDFHPIRLHCQLSIDSGT